jgi:hypothetical protein
MAGGYMNFTAATALSADVDNFLMRQTNMRFTSTSDRDTQLSGALESGMWAVTLDTHSEWYYNGSAWVAKNTPWTAYTPAWTNLTVGSATVAGKYRYAAGDLRCRGTITLAADSSVTGTVFQTIPNSVTADAGWQGGVGLINDTGTRIYPATIGVTASGTTFTWIHAESGNGGQINATNPFTFGTGDQLTWDFTVGV